MKQAKQILDKILCVICAVLMAFMSILVVYQVFTRYVLNNPSTFSEDLLTYAFVWMSLLSTALVFGEQDHMKLFILADKVNGKGQIILSIVTELIILVITYIICLNGGKSFMNVGAMQVSPTLHIRMVYVYAILPAAGVLIVIYCILNIGLLASQFMKPKGDEKV